MYHVPYFVYMYAHAICVCLACPCFSCAYTGVCLCPRMIFGEPSPCREWQDPVHPVRDFVGGACVDSLVLFTGHDPTRGSGQELFETSRVG